MTFAPDLSNMRDGQHPYYSPIAGVDQLAVGWLADTCPRGAPSEPFLEKLVQWIAETPKLPWTCAGLHPCALAPCASQGGRAACGKGEIYVPHVRKGNTLFCAPTLIGHYVAVHGYEPPRDFVESIMASSLEDIPKLTCRDDREPSPSEWGGTGICYDWVRRSD